MFAKCCSGAVSGVEAHSIDIEVDTTVGTSSFAIVGLPDTAVKEAKDRIPAAIGNSGFSIKREYEVMVNLAPADVRKEGPIYDLPIAVAFLGSIGCVAADDLGRYGLVGELALSGKVRPVRGVLPMVLQMRRQGCKAVLVPVDNAREASVVDGIDVIPVRTLREAVEYLSGEKMIIPMHTDISRLIESRCTAGGDDFADIKGQAAAVEAVTVAVAGGHNLLMIGSPGSGKTMLARRIPTILPAMSVEEALEVSRIHSVAGPLKGSGALTVERPFRAPHHTVSSIGLLGGGTRPVPGEVSLAHRGVLFLDEFAEFPRNALEVLRQPLEDGHVSVSRASAACDFPSRFMLVAAMNPCPCGYYNDRKHRCRCTLSQILKYQNRISGPLLDRIDLHIEVPAVDVAKLSVTGKGVPSAELRSRVIAAREMQRSRYANMPGVSVNAEARSRDLADICRLTPAMCEDVSRMIEKLDLSARAYDKVLRVARTVADLEGAESVSKEHLLVAAMYRRLDSHGEESFWA